MTTYIIWDKTDDIAFRARYLDMTGEKIQARPQESETQYMVGSGRITPEQLALLSSEFTISTDSSTFVPIEEQ